MFLFVCLIFKKHTKSLGLILAGYKVVTGVIFRFQILDILLDCVGARVEFNHPGHRMSPES